MKEKCGAVSTRLTKGPIRHYLKAQIRNSATLSFAQALVSQRGLRST